MSIPQSHSSGFNWPGGIVSPDKFRPATLLPSGGRNKGGGADNTRNWIHEFSKILTAPPAVEILRAEELKDA